MSIPIIPDEAITWTVCVVVLMTKNPRKYKNYYVCVSGDREAAMKMQDQIAKRGFKADDRRFFPDEIETLSLKQVGDKLDGK